IGWNNRIHKPYLYVYRLLQPFVLTEAPYGAHRNVAGHTRRAGAGARAFHRRGTRDLAPGIPPGAGRNRSARGTSIGRRPDRAVDGGREPDKMASRSRHMVF